MNRTQYKGVADDAVNATLSAAGLKFRKLLAFFLRLLLGGGFTLQIMGSRNRGTILSFAPA